MVATEAKTLTLPQILAFVAAFAVLLGDLLATVIILVWIVLNT